MTGAGAVNGKEFIFVVLDGSGVAAVVAIAREVSLCCFEG